MTLVICAPILLSPKSVSKCSLTSPLHKRLQPVLSVSDTLALASDPCEQRGEQVSAVPRASDTADLMGSYCASAFSQ